MTDTQALELLRLLHLYVTSYTPDIPQTLRALAEDLAIGHDVDETGIEAAALAESIRQTVGV